MTVPQILVVDDEELLRELVQACLEDLAGWETMTAASGEECLQLAQRKQFDAILLDMSMPGMDGYEVYERLQSNPMTRSIPVILLTAKVLPSDRDRFEKMGVAGVIAKPIEPTTLTEAIAEILGWDE
jgi:CheY-like chemotaxis protein